MSQADSCQEFVAVITALGWSADRRVDTSAAVAAWEARGHFPNEAALQFVASFDGIEFQYPRLHLPGTRPTDWCLLDASYATRSVADVIVRNYEARVSENLCPVGMASSGHLVLLMASTGNTYGGYDNFLALYGDSGLAALCNIYLGRKGMRFE
jgi:hypothetical protein